MHRSLRYSHVRFVILCLLVVAGLYVVAAAESKSPPLTVPDSNSGTSFSIQGDNQSSGQSSARVRQPNSDATSSNASTSDDISVSLNGKSVPVPADGSTHQELRDDTGSTSIDIDHASSAQGSSLNVTLRSTSTTSGGGSKSY